MIKKMKAQLFYGPGDVRYEETDIPEVGPGEALVRIRSALTCGSDLKTYKRGHPTMIADGSVFGHEWAGDIIDLGQGVKDFSIGDRVVAVNSVPCFRCYYCKLERYSMCENLVYNNGAYAEYIKIPANILSVNTLKIPEHIGYGAAALIEPLACAVHGIDESNITSYFTNEGNLAKAINSFEEREQQITMAKLVTDALNNLEFLTVEAGTGTGKSMAYLLPAVEWATTNRENRERVIVSTNTKNLQEQLFFKDIPTIYAVTNNKFKAVLLKGKSNYLCLDKWKTTLTDMDHKLTPSERSRILPLLL